MDDVRRTARQRPEDTFSECELFVSLVLAMAVQEGIPVSVAPGQLSSAGVITRGSAENQPFTAVNAAKARLRGFRATMPLFPPMFACRVLVEGRAAVLFYTRPALGLRTIGNPYV